MDVDTSENSSLRSLIGDEAGVIGSQGEDEAVVDDLAPQAPSHAGGEGFDVLEWTHRNICDMTAVKRKRHLEEGKMIEKRQWTSAKRRKDSHSYRGIPKNPEITVAQNAGEFKKKEETVLRRRTKRLGRIL